MTPPGAAATIARSAALHPPETPPRDPPGPGSTPASAPARAMIGSKHPLLGGDAAVEDDVPDCVWMGGRLAALFEARTWERRRDGPTAGPHAPPPADCASPGPGVVRTDHAPVLARTVRECAPDAHRSVSEVNYPVHHNTR
ncbi:MAG: hypothetical protein GQ558_09900 [Thermoplasmata archaeon]|nr:hypothetical protein [Thermoplasmata archaeon]